MLKESSPPSRGKQKYTLVLPHRLSYHLFMQKKWAEIHQNLEKVLTPAEMEVWISSLRPCAHEGALVLLAKNSFMADFVRKKLLGKIEKAAADAQLAASIRIESPDRFTPSPAIPEKAAPSDPAPCLTDPAGMPPGATHERAAKIIPSPRPLPNLQFALPLSLPSMEESPGQTANPAQAENRRSWRFAFEDFVVGPSNELAYAASRSVCDSLPGTDVLFLSSSPGLGKTHLMHAVGQALSSKCNRQTPRMDYLTAEEFASRFYLSIKGSDTDRFKARYRNLDMLLLEDVHFLQGKEKMQAELLATVKAVHDRGGKVIFSSSFSPRDLTNMDDQLQSRLTAGLVTVIQSPDLETRKRIFRKKAAMHQVILTDDVTELLAGHIRTDIRQIESCLHNLILKARLFNTGITMRMAWEAVSEFASRSPVLNLDAIIKYVCQCFGLSSNQLVSKSRKQEYVAARNTAFYLARKHTDMSLEAIGECFNRRHSTVLKGITNLERELSRQTPAGRQIHSALELIEKNGNLACIPLAETSGLAGIKA